MSIFNLPDLGEGLPDAEIAQWFVRAGDWVKQDQTLVAVETAKALVDIPSPQAGRIVKLFGQAGDVINTGDPLLEYGQAAAPATTSARKESVSVVGDMPTSHTVIAEKPHAIGDKTAGVKATPAVRALAHRMGVELNMVTPSGPNGTVKASDVERVAKILQQVGKLEPLTGVRRAMAISMTKAHAQVAQVTLNDDADLHAWDAQQDVTVRLIRALITAIRHTPALNAWYDDHAIGRRLVQDIHLGIAVDAEEGLFVPVIRNVDQLPTNAIRDSIDALKVALKNRSIAPENLRGHTIALSNFGGIGGRYATPIVLPPTVAILAAGVIRREVVADGDDICIHPRMPLSLSFDHRAVTGGEACRFLAALINDLAQAS